MKIIFFDTETTGIGEQDRLCQLAVKERGVGEPMVNAIYKPPLPISIEAMSIHHITEKMTEGRPLFSSAPEYGEIKNLFEHGDTISVAHNAAFDVSMLSREEVEPAAVICTYKVVRALDTDESFSQHKLQYLRYALGFDIDAAAHSAFGDVLILESLFEYLMSRMLDEHGSEEAALSEMLAISKLPMLFSTMRVGKHKGRKLADIARTDRSYLEWFLGEKKKSGETDWVYTLEHYLAKAAGKEAAPF